MRITWDNIEEILKQLDKASCVRFAIFCAEQVRHLNTDPAADAAIDAAKYWLASPNEENANAAHAAANATYAANATCYTAYAACAACAAYTAADAAYAADATYATYAAYVAANAADIDREQIKQEQVDYLKQLYLESLPEDERNCWLVRATMGV